MVFDRERGFETSDSVRSAGKAARAGAQWRPGLTFIAKRQRGALAELAKGAIPDSNPGSPSRHRLARLSPALICRLDRTTDLMSSYAAPASELANAVGVQGAQATEKHMRHKMRCARRKASGNKRAPAGEAMAGGAADWNEGVPVAVGSMGRAVYLICRSFK